MRTACVVTRRSCWGRRFASAGGEHRQTSEAQRVASMPRAPSALPPSRTRIRLGLAMNLKVIGLPMGGGEEKGRRRRKTWGLTTCLGEHGLSFEAAFIIDIRSPITGLPPLLFRFKNKLDLSFDSIRHHKFVRGALNSPFIRLFPNTIVDSRLPRTSAPWRG